MDNHRSSDSGRPVHDSKGMVVISSTTRWSTVAVAVMLTAVTGCSEPEPEPTASDPDPAVETTCAPTDLLECARGSTIGALVPDEAVEASGEPIRIGMINQENTAAGSFPELSLAVQAGVDFANQHLGGIDGRPIELDVCNTDFTVEGSTRCGQRFVEADVPVVLGGIDVFGNAVDILEENGVPFVGGIPVSSQSMTSSTSFQWSGGTWGATVAFARYAATELDASSVAIVYGDFGSIAQGAEYGAAVLEEAGVDTRLVPFPIMATDISSALQAAAAGDPDAVIVLTADTACRSALEGMAALDTDATSFYVGACAAPSIIDELGTDVTDGVVFSVEGPIRQEGANPDFDLYAAVLDRYAEGLDPVGAGTVSFRSFVNLYAVLREIGADDLTPVTITESLRSQQDTPSYMGHAYTCDGDQFSGLPAACSPQQILAEMHDRELTQLTDWIDVGAAYPG